MSFPLLSQLFTPLEAFAQRGSPSMPNDSNALDVPTHLDLIGEFANIGLSTDRTL